MDKNSRAGRGFCESQGPFGEQKCLGQAAQAAVQAGHVGNGDWTRDYGANSGGAGHGEGEAENQ